MTDTTIEDLRVSLATVSAQLAALIETVAELKAAIALAATDRRLETKRVEDIEREQARMAGAITMLRWISGAVSTALVSGVLWIFTHVTDADNANRAQDLRLQALERGQFAETVKGRP